MTQEYKGRYLAVRKKLIEHNFRHLNDMQREAVKSTEGPLLILAGAGSGKTTVLISRIANLIMYGADTGQTPENISEADVEFLEAYYAGSPDMSITSGDKDSEYDRVRDLLNGAEIKPWRIMAITFTNKAADEMKERLKKTLGSDGEDIWAMTFHSACVRILRRDIDRLGYERAFTIYDTSDSQSLMKRILSEMNVDEKSISHKTVLNYISTAKDSMTNPGTFYKEAEKSGDIRRKTIGLAYEEYENRLKAANAVDFDGLLLLTVRLLLEHKDIREYYQQRFQYVLIDEYQDTNNLQYLFASTLAAGYKNICVVGDDDQSIYKFRGASIENILNFENQYKQAKTIRLEQNYRSTGRILEAANAVIANNQGRKGKKLWTEHDFGEQVELHTANGEREEAGFVAGKILEGVAQGKSWGDHAVLYRMNALSNQLEFAFKREGIPYKVIGGMRFFDRAEIKDITAYLCALNNPSDDLRLLRIINVPARGIGQTSISKVTDIAKQEGRSVYEVIADAANYPDLARASVKLRQFRIMIDELRDSLENMRLDEFYDTLIEKTGYVRMLEGAKDDNTAKVENIWELKTNIVRFTQESEDGSLAAFLDEISLYTDLQQMDNDGDCVIMMTLHSAKGLEFPTVFIVGMEDGIFPGMRSIGETEEMEEERRLCYVGITRAKEMLYLTCAKSRMLFGKTTSNKRSRFIEELPMQYLTVTGALSVAETSRRIYGSSEPRESKIKTYGFADDSAKTPVSSRPKMPGQSGDDFKMGDQVEHKAFGRGTISSMEKAGNDALIEIIFDSMGTKKLMLRAASKHMVKI